MLYKLIYSTRQKVKQVLPVPLVAAMSKVRIYLFDSFKLSTVKGYVGSTFLQNIQTEQMIQNKVSQTNYKEIDFSGVEFYEEEHLNSIESNLYGKVEGTNYSKSEMTHKERAFINGIIRKTKPITIAEIGISAGGSSCVILHAIRDIEGAKLFSFDYNTTWYREINHANARKSGFLVKEIVPELSDKWELYTGGVPCKYFDNLPVEGVDVCLIDTAHFNPGVHLNVLEILPFMKKNGIIIYHNTNFHCLYKEHRTTNCVAINTLNGKQILLKSEYTMGLPNVRALVLDENTDELSYKLFSNLSLPWSYKISDDDFLHMFKHFMKYYPKDLVQIYIYYCYFYLNGGMQNKETATVIAEKQSLIFQQAFENIKIEEPSNKTVVAMLNPSPNNTPSETFIKIQKDRINAKVNYYSNGTPPMFLNGDDLRIPKNTALTELFKQSTETKLSDKELILATSLINERTDVVFAQYGTTGADLLNVCRLMNLPLIVHFHGFDISRHAVIKDYATKYQAMFKYASFIIAVSQYMKNVIIKMGCPSEKIIYNPCAPNDKFYQIKPSFNKKQFIAAGRFTPKKAPHLTIIAFKKVLEKHPDARLVLAGDGELYRHCHRLVKKHKMEKSVYLPGVYNFEQYEQWLNESIAFVQHSMTVKDGDMEGTPVSLSEASLSGLPIISTLHAGIPDVIINNETGLLSEEGDTENMVKNMLWVLDNPATAKEMGLAGKKFMWENFNMSKHIKILDDIIYKAKMREKLSK